MPVSTSKRSRVFFRHGPNEGEGRSEQGQRCEANTKEFRNEFIRGSSKTKKLVNKKVPVRRGRKKKNKTANIKSFSLIGANTAGLKEKFKSLVNIIENVKPSCVLLQETKMLRKGWVKIEGYQTFELVRKETGGGGLATCVIEELEPVLISEGDDQSELLVVEVRINSNTKARIFNAYGP